MPVSDNKFLTNARVFSSGNRPITVNFMALLKSISEKATLFSLWDIKKEFLLKYTLQTPKGFPHSFHSVTLQPA
jgi:hypothetical protein